MRRTGIRKKVLLVTAIVAISSVSLLLGACAQTDVVAKISTSSFAAVLEKADVQKDDENTGWSLSAPDKSARFIWSRDFKTSAPHDVMLEVDARPFIDAGLDTGKLPAGMFVDGKIMVGQELGEQTFPESAQETALASYEQLLKNRREVVGYHAALDHYGVEVGGGSMFEWAKDIGKNDKDIVFVLDPKMLTDAGVDPAKVDGWLFAKVEVMDKAGKKAEVEKFLKPFDFTA